MNSEDPYHRRLTIKCAESDGLIHFSERTRPDDEGWLSFLLEVKVPGIQAEVRAELNESYDGVTGYFADLAKSWKGWKGEKWFEPVDPYFKFVATHTGIGSIDLRLELTDRPGMGWTASVPFPIEPGEQMSQLASDVKAFFA